MYQMVPRIVLMLILLSFGTKVFKKGVLVYGFPLFEYVFLCWNITTVVEAVHSKREKWYKILYQLVPETILMVILFNFGTKVFKKDVLVYGFPLLEYGSHFSTT